MSHWYCVSDIIVKYCPAVHSFHLRSLQLGLHTHTHSRLHYLLWMGSRFTLVHYTHTFTHTTVTHTSAGCTGYAHVLGWLHHTRLPLVHTVRLLFVCLHVPRWIHYGPLRLFRFPDLFVTFHVWFLLGIVPRYRYVVRSFVSFSLISYRSWLVPFRFTWNDNGEIVITAMILFIIEIEIWPNDQLILIFIDDQKWYCYYYYYYWRNDIIIDYWYYWWQIIWHCYW